MALFHHQRQYRVIVKLNVRYAFRLVGAATTNTETVQHLRPELVEEFVQLWLLKLCREKAEAEHWVRQLATVFACLDKRVSIIIVVAVAVPLIIAAVTSTICEVAEVVASTVVYE